MNQTILHVPILDTSSAIPCGCLPVDMGGAVVLGSCKMVLLIALDYVVILSARLLKAGLPAMLCFCFLYNTIPVRLIIWQSTTPIIPKFCRLKSRPKFQKVLTRVDCSISQLAFHADDPVTEKALSATPWRTMKLLYLRALDRSRLSSQRSQCSVNFCEILRGDAVTDVEHQGVWT